MANKGLKSLAESTPNFSNQALENAVDNLKIGWVAKSIELDTAITDSTVLTDSQKNDLKDTIDNVPHINVGRYLNDLLRHSSSIIDGSIMPLDTTVVNPEPGTFLEILQLVQTLQTLIPDLFGVTPEEKNRGVNDHLGTLNNVFLETEDSSLPVFTSLQNAISFLDNKFQSAHSTLGVSIDNLKNFVVGLSGDSTDFQTSLDNRATVLATAQTDFNDALASEPFLTKRLELIAGREAINTQINLENTNLNDIRTYSDTLTDNLSFTSLAEDSGLRKLMSNVAQNANWKSYFNNFEANEENLNPIYTLSTDSDKSYVIDQVLASRGLPDVLDSNDIDSVANKAKLDSRIDTKGFEVLTVEKIIEDCCKQLGLYTYGNVFNQSKRLLNNLNQRDRDLVAEELDSNEDADTIS
tara:strand:- start:169 stop:1398 length:1230 start_codon:yes stop_codon:yes gene_type:complete